MDESLLPEDLADAISLAKKLLYLACFVTAFALAVFYLDYRLKKDIVEQANVLKMQKGAAPDGHSQRPGHYSQGNRANEPGVPGSVPGGSALHPMADPAPGTEDTGEHRPPPQVVAPDERNRPPHRGGFNAP